ncbi:erythromycin esterase family protein [Streptomyces bathyalis]|uniref:Erythromycin esterase family protein n=1 Tax=Streptomyces bathyalis TaxID=2710756 RepID=A0A7T1T9H9_9ACTN|nr:erythromycin esterase family protein [Streptomyces bathyalis]QPP08885.1 erythromycin esterase family protein [Streptomyces bathyalis]
MADQSSSRDVLADWFREHATTLATLDPRQPLDDLEPLRDIVGEARVVAVGENAHFVEEFSLARRRVLRFLAERCGFSVFAFEFGFSEAFALDRWLQGEGDDGDLANVSRSAADWGAADLMHWLRRHNRTGRSPLRFAGIDLPEAGGALRPALEPVAEYLREADPAALPVLETALEISDRFLDGAGSGAAAAPAWAGLPVAEQDALTASLARLLLRLRAVEPLCVSRSSQSRFDIALRRVEAACHTDHMFRAMNGLMSGHGAAADLSVRETFMAESVRWHLDHAGPDARIVLAAHNNHIQTTALEFDGALTALPMGQHLRRMLGRDYRSVALVHTADHVPEMFPDPSAEVGFTLADADLEPAEEGSVEAALIDAGHGDDITLTDLRRSPRDAEQKPLLRRIRTQSAVLSTPVLDAFDAVLAVPTVTRDRTVRF